MRATAEKDEESLINGVLEKNGTFDNEKKKNQYQGHTVNELMNHLRLADDGLLMGTVNNALAWVLLGR